MITNSTAAQNLAFVLSGAAITSQRANITLRLQRQRKQ